MFKTDQECIDFMKDLDRQFSELLELLGDKPERLPWVKVEEARDRLRRLKGDLRTYYDQHQTNRAQAKMLPIEKTHCLPAVHESMVEIYVTPNYRPSARWYHELYSAQETFQNYLWQLTGIPERE
jgi:hypothetical protein